MLDIHPHAKNFTCVGSAISRGSTRCRWGIDEKSRQRAYEIMSTMRTKAPAADENTFELLRSLASALLCVKTTHQNQIEVTARAWFGRIEEYLAECNKRRGLIAHAQDFDRLRQELLDTKLARQNADALNLESAAYINDLQSQLAAQLEETTQIRASAQATLTRNQLQANQVELSSMNSRSQATASLQIQDLHQQIQTLEARMSKYRLRDYIRVFQLSMWKGRCEKLQSQIDTLLE